MPETKRLTICVFCGARPGTSPALTEAAEQIGRLIGERGHRLVYGGGGSGLMGSVAWAAHRGGAPITGVITTLIAEREKAIAAPPQRVEVVPTMTDRKQRMLNHADAFLALAGGYGTLDEVLDVLSLRYLGDLNKPVVLLGVERCWDRFEQLIADVHHRGYARYTPEPLYAVRTSPLSAITTLESEWAAVHTTALAPAGRALAPRSRVNHH